MERYRQQGLTASLEALQTMYPGVNMTDILMEDLGEEAGEMEGGENELQGSEGGGGGKYGEGHPGKYHPYQSLASDYYGDYEVDFLGQPKASYRYVPAPPADVGNMINPTPVVLRPKTANTEGGQARLFDSGVSGGGGGGGQNVGPYNPERVVRHSTEMTASATLGVVVGTIIISWLIVGPAVCLAWRWNEKRRDRNKILLQRPQLHGSVDEGIMDAMVMSELGKAGGKKRGSSSSAAARRQREADVEASLARNRSELESFPTTSTLESRVI